ncbi:retrovirus-related pol polyprotein from transposon TNT 1-94 [Tanacetum coccineum]
MYGFKECSSCGALYNREHCCSNVSSVDNFVRDPNPIYYDETSDSSQQPPRNCSKCGGLFGGLYCRQCTCEWCRRNYTDEVCALCCYEVEKSFVNDSNPNSFIDSPNIFNPPPQPQTYSCEFCGNNAHYGYDCPPQVPFIYNLEPCYNQDFDNDFPQKKQHQQKDIQELLRKLLKDLQIISEELADYINTPNWNCPAFYDNDDEDDDEEYTIAITPVLPTVEPDNSLMRTYDLWFYFLIASPTDSELVSLEEVKDFDTEDGEIDTDILLTIKDDILCEKILNINLLIAKIKALKDNPTPSTNFVLKSPSSFSNSFLEETDTFDNSLPESEIFCFDMEEKSSGNPTSHSDLSLPDYKAFYYDNEPDLENITIECGYSLKSIQRFLSPNERSILMHRDYAGATLDRKSTTGGCQFLGNRLISWQCKKQTVVATSTTEAEYVAAASCCGQVQDLGSIIDSGLSEVVLGQPFTHTSKLTYDESLGLIRFAQRDDEVVFRMPQRTKELDLVSSFIKDKFKAFFMENLKVIFDEKKLGSS